MLAATQLAAAPAAHAEDFLSRLFGGAFWKSPDDHSVAEKPAPTAYAKGAYCVRLCDGYYWPISAHQGGQRGQAACQASCAAPARVYRTYAFGQPAEDMRDLDGHRYSELPTAFKYRKLYEKSCSCRPVPWSTAEKQRHAKYAELASEGKLEQYLAETAQTEQSAIATASISASDQRLEEPVRRRARAQKPARTQAIRQASPTPQWKRNLFGH